MRSKNIKISLMFICIFLLINESVRGSFTEYLNDLNLT